MQYKLGATFVQNEKQDLLQIYDINKGKISINVVNNYLSTTGNNTELNTIVKNKTLKYVGTYEPFKCSKDIPTELRKYLID